MKSAIEQLNEIIRYRRSIQPTMFNGNLIPDKDVQIILDNANFAPTHRKTEPWRFIVYSGDSLKKLSEYSSNWYRENTIEFSDLKFEKTKQKALKSSHVIAIIMQRHEKLLPEWEEIASVACAVQNIWLSATAMGIAGYWSSPKYAIEGNDFFKLGPKQRCLGLFYLGYASDIIPDKSYYPVSHNKVEWR